MENQRVGKFKILMERIQNGGGYLPNPGSNHHLWKIGDDGGARQIFASMLGKVLLVAYWLPVAAVIRPLHSVESRA